MYPNTYMVHLLCQAWYLSPNRKQTTWESLEKFITFHKARTVYLWRLEQKQSFYQIQLLEILYVLFSRYKTKSEKTLFYSWPPMPLEIDVPPRGWSQGVPSMPSQWSGPLFSSQTHVILLLQVSSLTLNNLHYIVSDLWKAARPAQVTEKREILIL
jgi:hypothetical protein